MFKKKNILLVFVYTFLFTVLLFLAHAIFFDLHEDEEKYVEPVLEVYEKYESFSGVTQQEINSAVADIIYKEFSEKYSKEQKNKVVFRYVPTKLFETIKYSYTPLIETFVYNRDILSDITKLSVVLHENIHSTRGRMKSGHVHLYGVTQMPDQEFLSVFIHEFGHYIDIYGLPRSSFGDESQKFYDISWDSVTTMKGGMKSQDFVSGYAMTNWYEDFAESYTYYILHNENFFKKSQESETLLRKYDFFTKYIFPRNTFYKVAFSGEEHEAKYSWDITKLPVDVKKFLQYMQNDI